MIYKKNNEDIPAGSHAVVAMSGGVDSSVCAALLLEKGVKVTGVTMNQKPQGQDQDIADAKSVCALLGIEHHVVNLVQEYASFLMREVQDVYARGETPNPCVVCNQQIKFGMFFQKLLENSELFPNDTYIASGHYARIVLDTQGDYHVAKGIFKEKDQSYFLYRLSQKQLSRVRFPLGEMIKPDVRKLAEKFQLPTRNKPDSQDFCLGKVDLRPKESSKVDIYHQDGTFLTAGDAIAKYTIGQRRGLGISGGDPLFVLTIDKAQNRIIVGPEQGLYHKECTLKNIIFAPHQVFPVQAQVRIRSMGKDCPASLKEQTPGTINIVFDEPQRAITPGQSAVVYMNDVVLGGGFIDKVE
ncbi:MAG: tRNA 2-thiouridine(34) synthase MnmA [Spirochaetia bacterium]